MNPLGTIFTFSTLLISLTAGELPVHNWLNHRFKRDLVDLHNGEFCVDVSTYTEVQYRPEPREKCDSTFEKQCEEKTEEVCDEVTEIVCEVVPYTDCQMIMENTPYKSFKMVEKPYDKIECEEGMKSVPHQKMMPECRNVTKQNCVTKWETDENGNQVWAGNEDCEPVTWRECKLVPREVEFKVPQITCAPGETIQYEECEEDTKEQMTTSMLCEVKHTTSCQPKVSEKCASITYTECQELPNEECNTVDIQVPFQEKEHKKKCLLPDNGIAPTSIGGGAADAAADDETAAASNANADYAEPAAAAASAAQADAAQAQPTYQSPRGGRNQQAFRHQQQQVQNFQRQGRQQQQFRHQQQQQQNAFLRQSQRQFSQRTGQQQQPRSGRQQQQAFVRQQQSAFRG